MRLSRSIVAVVMLLSGAALAAQQSDVLRTLGIDANEVNNSIVGSFTNGTLNLIGEAAVFKAASPEQRALLVRGAIAAARAYTGTADFARRYAEFREAQRPEQDTVPQSGAEAMAAQQKQLEEVIKEAQKMAAQLPAEARQQLIDNIAEMKKQLAEINADPEHRANIDAAAKEGAREAATEYAQRVASFNASYPADPKQLIARRLRSFLDLSGTVDYSAKLEQKEDKRMHFVDPALDRKPRDWKLMYRAGRPAVDAARAAAEEWLKALGV